MTKTRFFKLNDCISIATSKGTVIGKLVGIDHYSLDGFDGKQSQWLSYTLVSGRKDKFSRYWFVCWGMTNWILWLQAKTLAVPTDAKLVPSKSGIARIGFEGEAGVSTPYAALVQYETEKGYFSAERFAGSEVMYFTGKKISKPRTTLTV